MLIANFTKKDEEIELDELWMYDYGQKLQINGLNLPDIFEVHFFWNGLNEAKVQTGYTENGISMVDIPNEGLTQKRAITAYIYLSSPEDGETINTVIMYVNKRVVPEGFETPEDIDLFHHTLFAVEEFLKRTQQASENATNKSDEAEGWAHGRADMSEREHDNAMFYSECAKQVATKNGFCYLTIEEDGNLYLSRTDNIEQLNFRLNENDELEVIISE